MSLITKIAEWRSANIIGKIDRYLTKTDRIVDIGCGVCSNIHILQQKGYQVKGVDISNLSLYPSIKPLNYDGQTLPYKDHQFDVSILCTVLHHVPLPENLIKEALRVSRKLIIYEDIYHGKFNRRLTYIMDSITNLQFYNHPHTNKSDVGWRNCFKKLNLKLIHSQKTKFWVFFENGIYLITK